MIPDYDKALYYTLWGQWDELLILMVRTNDDLLSKRIEKFLNAYHYSLDEDKIMKSHDQLLYYIDHAMQQDNITTMEV
ncbi:YhdB family protein [Oceanobacillus luteolus]|uniref:YhdB family protein n=1 Tax=Oceanobacillus luteolus TaxID=1274358 RepID=A0ABW4HRC1_9BACI|nr:YhdB family protein [Oceanobacillus luteolus]MCM3739601.1 YhdB family protein [Oceanobacillus luteolus]